MSATRSTVNSQKHGDTDTRQAGLPSGRRPDRLAFLTARRVAVAVFVVLGAVYLGTLAPTFGFADRGELAAVASTLGVAHPTGYPTMTLLGWLVTVVAPVGDVVALNALSALLTAAGGAALVLLLARLAKIVEADETPSSRPKRSKGTKPARSQGAKAPARDLVAERAYGPRAPLSSGVVAALAGLTALLVGLTATWWSQATSFEVFSLHALMLPLVTLLFVRFADDAARSRQVGFTWSGITFGLVLGLSFSNHLTTLLLAPSLLVWYFWRLGVNRRAGQRLLFLVPPFLLGLTPYLYLPLRAASGPTFNWGNPETLWGFWRHVTGAQFQSWMFTNPGTFGPHTGYALGNLAWELAYVGLGLAVLGVIALAPRAVDVRRPSNADAQDRRRVGYWWSLGLGVTACLGVLYLASAGETEVTGERVYPVLVGYLLVLAVVVAAAVGFAGRSVRAQVGLAAVLALLVCLLYAGGYDIMVELRPYYLTAFFAAGILAFFGLAWLAERLRLAPVLVGASVLVTAVGVINLPMANERDHTLVEDMAVNVLSTLPDDALVLSKQWSFWVAGSYYLQEVGGMRPDVLVVDFELLRRSWYLDQLEANHPELMAPIGSEVDAFRVELAKFERDEPYDPQRIEETYVGLIDSMIENAIDDRPVFITADFDEAEPRADGRPYYASAYQRAPAYLTYQLVESEDYVPQEFPDYRFQFASGPPDWHTLMMYWWYASSSLARAQYEHQHGNIEVAQRYLDHARSFDPGVTLDDVVTEPLSRPQAEHVLQSFQQLQEQRLPEPATADTSP